MQDLMRRMIGLLKVTLWMGRLRISMTETSLLIILNLF